MAAKTDPIAAKKAKQTKILIALSVVLVAILAIQMPRILGGDDSKTTDAAPAADATATPSATSAVAESAAPATAAPVDLATVSSAATAKPGVAQLASFSLFETKDPFVQGIVVKEVSAAGVAAASDAGAKPAGAVGGAPSGGGGVSGAPAQPVLTFATIAVNKVDEPVQVEQTFPADDPLFVLARIKPKSAKIGIAGGSLENGDTVTLTMGKKLTLVNDATGARYTLELLYTGTQPEQIASFSSDSGTADTTQAATATP